MHAAFIGSAGIPNKYGGFEAFLEHSGPGIAAEVGGLVVTCDGRLYEERGPEYQGVHRRFLAIPANGAWSVLHDLFAFLMVYRRATHVVVLGVSGGLWFPLFRLLCSMAGKRLLVNVDGLEWRRTKFTRLRRLVLRLFDTLAQASAHVVIYDNPALREYLFRPIRSRAVHIGYSGDHVLRVPDVRRRPRSALTVCRIEPENNVHLLIEGALRSTLERYTVVGNWSNSPYGRRLRELHENEPRLRLLDPIYDARRLAGLREECAVYIHGHSVGGTNPSLVEMLFYDCQLLCFDCVFNRETAGAAARYFTGAGHLAELLSTGGGGDADRGAIRARFSRDAVVAGYVTALIDA